MFVSAIFSIFYWLIIGTLTVFIITPAWIFNLLSPNRVRVGKVLWIWSKIVRRIIPVKVKIVYEQIPNAGEKYILIATQASHAESLIFPSLLSPDLVWVINQEYANIPIYGWFRRPVSIVIRRDRKNAALKKLLTQGLKVLREGYSVGISPEGFRSKTGKLQEFQNGPFVLAMKSGTPLLPVIAEGISQILPYGSWIIRRGEVKITFKTMIDPGNFQEVRELKDYAHSVFSNALENGRGISVPSKIQHVSKT